MLVSSERGHLHDFPDIGLSTSRKQRLGRSHVQHFKRLRSRFPQYAHCIDDRIRPLQPQQPIAWREVAREIGMNPAQPCKAPLRLCWIARHSK
jgi:hypothetical protein